MRHALAGRITLAALLLGAAPAARAQDSAPPPGADSVTVVPGARYERGGLFTFFFGEHHRDLWTTPIRVPVLDLDTLGGLRPTEVGGGRQTRSLRFLGGNGKEYAFRSVDKDPSAVLPEELRGTVADDIVQDQISAAHPVGALVADPFLEAVGVLHAPVRLLVMPDDPRLGEFREQFAGMLGLLEERPDDDVPQVFAGADDVDDTYRLLERMEEEPETRVARREYLASRLVDLLLGDWDRHQEQLEWVRLEDDESSPWRPVPRDRDQALSRYDGLLLGVARASAPQLVVFDDEYPSINGLTWNGRMVDRRLLPALDRATWDSVARAVQSRITDSVIAAAVGRLPEALRLAHGAELAATLRARRDGLRAAADAFYRHLAEQPDVHTTDAAERADLVRAGDSLAVTVRAGEMEVFRRTFRSGETGEIRLYFHGGDDTVVVRGDGGGPAVRIVGGGGDDLAIDSASGGWTRLYDHRGANRAEGMGWDRRAFDDFTPSEETPYPPRDWGTRWRGLPWLSAGPGIGVFTGVGAVRYAYGFRQRPHASRIEGRLGYAFGAQAFRAELRGDFRRAASDLSLDLLARASGVEIIRFHGYGNETPLTGEDEFYRVQQSQYLFRPALRMPLGERLTVTAGPRVQYVTTELEPGRFISLAPPYGAADPFGQLGAEAEVLWDGRDRPGAATRGGLVRLAGQITPAVWDAEETFGAVEGAASTYLTAPVPLRPTLALRVGGRRVWGDFPLHEAAFVGGAATVRGLREQRYAGDAAVYGNAELRLGLGRFFVLMPGTFGVFGLADAGRVWLEGERSDEWHEGFGGGIWVAFLDPANTVTVAMARAEGVTGVYFRAGFGY